MTRKLVNINSADAQRKKSFMTASDTAGKIKINIRSTCINAKMVSMKGDEEFVPKYPFYYPCRKL